MFRLLIADDEDLVRRGLAALIEREAPGLSIVGTAVDGLEALEMTARHKPDIVLTDIRMPGLSGLDLIERLCSAQPATRCIILSGYDDFGYARRAIGLSVSDYLLKPIDPDLLLAALARAQQQILSARAGTLALAEGQLRRLLDGLPVDETRLHATGDGWGLLLVRRCVPLAGAQATDTVPSLRAQVQHQIDGAVVTEDALGHLCVLLSLEGEARNCLAGCAHRLQRSLSESGFAATIIAAEPCGTLAQVAAAYSRAVALGEYQPEGRSGPVLAWEATPHGERWPMLPLAHRDAILRAIDDRDEAETRHQVRAFVESLRHLSPGAMRALYVEMAVLLVHHVQGMGVQADQLLDAERDPRRLLAGPPDLHTLGERLGDLAVRAVHACRRVHGVRTPRGTIPELCTYIAAHPHDDLSIGALARRLHLNPKYLGELFKHVTGEPLGEYVIRMRMQHACELLAGSPLKVYAIAEQVGYADARHFASMFRSVIGVPPAEYREQHRRPIEDAVVS